MSFPIYYRFAALTLGRNELPPLPRTFPCPLRFAYPASGTINYIMTTTEQHSLPQGVQRIWLVRHGQTLWNELGRFCGHTDIPLSTLGRRQARKLASHLQHMPISAIYSSDLSRTRETAEIIVDKIILRGNRETARVSPTHKRTEHVGKTLAVSLLPALREINFGAWEGLTYDEIVTSFADQLGFFTDPEHYAPSQGETLTEVLQRVMPALQEIMQHKHDGAIVIVSHGGVLRGLLCAFLGMPLRNQWQLRIDTGSLSAIDVSLDEHGEVVISLAGLNMKN